MFRHVVMFKWADGVTGEQQQAVAAELAKLPAQIPAIREYQFGPDAHVDPGQPLRTLLRAVP